MGGGGGGGAEHNGKQPFGTLVRLDIWFEGGWGGGGGRTTD